MTANDIKLAQGCEHNYLWSCRHKYSYGQECTGPCKYCTTTQIRDGDIMCPICNSEVEFGYCVNKLCVNHGS